MTDRILIADDNEVARGCLSELLKGHDGWEVCAEVENGEQAVVKAKELRPDLIILDLAMPVMDGLRATREIGKILPSVPILIYTLHDAPWIELESKKAGARQVVSKPDAEALLRAVENLLKDQPREPVERPAVAATAVGPLGTTSASKVQPQPTESLAGDQGGSGTSVKAN